uniref:Uncharacterized protein n=1 Tax=Pseudonaja textilis TaxID=8673 RepID=A0A670ZEZ7_PSETE
MSSWISRQHCVVYSRCIRYSIREEKNLQIFIFYLCLFSPPKAECSTENRHRAEERNDGKHLPIKSKKGVKATHADVVGHHDHHPLHLAVAIGCHHLIPDLLKRGARIDDRTKSGQTALHLASRTLNQAAIQTLLHCGAQVNSTTPTTQETPLHLAVHTSSSKAGIVLGADGTCVELLLLNGADVGLKDWKGQAALHHACRNGREDLIHLLLSYGADANAVTSQAESCLFLFLEKASNLKKANILWKLLSLSYPVKLTNAEGRLPQLLDDPHWEPLKDILLQVHCFQWGALRPLEYLEKKNREGFLPWRGATDDWKVDSTFRPSEVGKMRTKIVEGHRLTL